MFTRVVPFVIGTGNRVFTWEPPCTADCQPDACLRYRCHPNSYTRAGSAMERRAVVSAQKWLKRAWRQAKKDYFLHVVILFRCVYKTCWLYYIGWIGGFVFDENGMMQKKGKKKHLSWEIVRFGMQTKTETKKRYLVSNKKSNLKPLRNTARGKSNKNTMCIAFLPSRPFFAAVVCASRS